jgi:hypothetical protein
MTDDVAIDDHSFDPEFFKRGNVLHIKSSKDGAVALYAEKQVRIIQPEANVGILAQLCTDEVGTSPILFIPFDENTVFERVPTGVAKFGKIEASTQVLDLGTGEHQTLESFYPAFLDELKAAAAAAPPPPAPGSEPDWSRAFGPGTIFALTSSTNPALARYVGKVFKSSHADNAGILAVPEQNSGLTDALYLPFDGLSEFTTNPPGTYSFANGVPQDQQVWNGSTGTYGYVTEFVPAYEPVSYAYYDPWTVPLAIGLGVGLAAAYDPYYYYDPYWYW